MSCYGGTCNWGQREVRGRWNVVLQRCGGGLLKRRGTGSDGEGGGRGAK